MITCPNNKCGYAYGWTHYGGNSNVFINPAEGEPFRLETFMSRVTARQIGECKEREVLGCPRCNNIFMALEEYEDVDTTT